MEFFFFFFLLDTLRQKGLLVVTLLAMTNVVTNSIIFTTICHCNKGNKVFERLVVAFHICDDLSSHKLIYLQRHVVTKASKGIGNHMSSLIFIGAKTSLAPTCLEPVCPLFMTTCRWYYWILQLTVMWPKKGKSGFLKNKFKKILHYLQQHNETLSQIIVLEYSSKHDYFLQRHLSIVIVSTDGI